MSGGPHSGSPSQPQLPSEAEARQIAEWLAGPRGRALRRASIGRREHVLEVGAGHCVVTPELQRRCQGTVTALDHGTAALKGAHPPRAKRIAADALSLPFRANSFDLVFFQNTLLWIPELESAVAEAVRVLEAGGALVAIEPDYGGMMEHPDWGIRQLWIQGLTEAGADPFVGRKLPAACEAAGLRTWVELAHIPRPAEAAALRLLDGLPLTSQQRQIVENVTQAVEEAPGQWSFFLHVPYFLIVATKQNRRQNR